MNDYEFHQNRGSGVIYWYGTRVQGHLGKVTDEKRPGIGLRQIQNGRSDRHRSRAIPVLDRICLIPVLRYKYFLPTSLRALSAGTDLLVDYLRKG